MTVFFKVEAGLTAVTEEHRGYKKNVHAYTKTWSSCFDMINKCIICLQRDATVFEDEYYGFHASEGMLYIYTLI